MHGRDGRVQGGSLLENAGTADKQLELDGVVCITRAFYLNKYYKRDLVQSVWNGGVDRICRYCG